MGKWPSKIFLDGADPVETAKAEQLLGFIDGQTTNPTLLAKNPWLSQKISRGEKFKEEELEAFYQKITREISAIVDWSVSVEPYVDKKTSEKEILEKARLMNSWSEKIWVKIPITPQGLTAAKMAVKEGIRVNLTLCFTQEQAAAAYAATKGTIEPAFVSPFVGRLDDAGFEGMDLVRNILKMYQKGDGHIQVVAASIRHLSHLFQAFKFQAPIVTLPFPVFEKWASRHFPSLGEEEGMSFRKPIPYQEISLEKPWQSYNLYHPLTEKGLERFAEDWQRLVMR